MSKQARRFLATYRKGEATDVENTLIDDLVDGKLGRRDFIIRGTAIGMSGSLLATVLAACGDDGSDTQTGSPATKDKAGAPKVGGRLRLGVIPAPVGKIDTITGVGVGMYCITGLVGEYLIRLRGKTLAPELATSWKPNADASVWTFKLRQGVKFQNGATMTADDVIATFGRVTDPKGGSQALASFSGVLVPDGVQKVDDLTVAFHLDRPTAGFAYFVTQAIPQTIIMPAKYDGDNFVKVPQGTGAFKLTSYTPGVGAKLDRNEEWWGGRSYLDGVDETFYSDAAAADSALLGGNIDLLNLVAPASDKPIFSAPESRVKIWSSPSAAHNTLPMRVDLDNPFKDPRVRQAAALAIDRPAMLETVWEGKGVVGNDSPFATIFPQTAKVPQRQQDLATAKELLEAAGYGSGFSETLTTYRLADVPLMAQVFAESAAKIGIDVKVKFLGYNLYYAGEQSGPPDGWGNTPWLNDPVTISQWPSSPPTPDIWLTSDLSSKSPWNASHYSNPEFDRLVKSYQAALSLEDQQKYAQQIQTILLDDTPEIIPYFYDVISAGSPKVQGYTVDANSVMYLSKVSLA